MVDYRDNTQKCEDYIHALEEEQRKIQVFQRELPLCLQLVTQTIEAYKQQLSGTTAATAGNSLSLCFNGGQAGKQQHSECSEQTTSDGGPILEEFIPINRTSSSVDNQHDEDDDDDELQSQNPKISNIFQDNNGCENNSSNSDKSLKKSDWLRSAQLWNQNTPDPLSTIVPTKEEHQPKKVSVVEVKQNGGNGGAFQPFRKDNTTTPAAANVIRAASTTASACSTADEAPAAAGGGARSGDSGSNGGGVCKKDEKECGQRKARRCWSQELHRKFLNALQQLGGSHVATPKQIRELMKVDGLTNDEVKSHLQKYRLHTRRPTPIHHHSSNVPSTQAPQFIVVGGLWVPPPPEYTTALAETASTAAATSAPSGIYTPNPTAQRHTGHVRRSRRPPEKKHSRNSDEIRSHSSHDVLIRSNSPSTSSSTHTTTASQGAS